MLRIDGAGDSEVAWCEVSSALFANERANGLDVVATAEPRHRVPRAPAHDALEDERAVALEVDRSRVDVPEVEPIESRPPAAALERPGLVRPLFSDGYSRAVILMTMPLLSETKTLPRPSSATALGEVPGVGMIEEFPLAVIRVTVVEPELAV